MPFQDQPTGTRAKAHQTISGRSATPQPTGTRAKAHQVISGYAPQQRPNGTQAKATQAASPPTAGSTVVSGSVLLITPEGAAAIFQASNAAGNQGPSNRVRAARSMTGIPYKQQTGTALRAGSTPDALAYMDCSEFVARVLAADGITKGILSMNTGAIKALVSQKDKFAHSTNTPKVGDIALWEGHVGIVSGVGKGNTMKLIHASGKGKLSGENKYAISPSKYRSGTFYGYYRPIQEEQGSSYTKPLHVAPKASTIPRPTQRSRGYTSDADGSFRLQEVIVWPAPNQLPNDSVRLPHPVIPTLNFPSLEGIPSKLPKR